MRVDFDGNRAVGVECATPDGPRRLTADRVVLGGGIGSAHLLMLSGIGPQASLGAAGVAVLVDLPSNTMSRSRT